MNEWKERVASVGLVLATIALGATVLFCIAPQAQAGTGGIIAGITNDVAGLKSQTNTTHIAITNEAALRAAADTAETLARTNGTEQLQITWITISATNASPVTNVLVFTNGVLYGGSTNGVSIDLR